MGAHVSNVKTDESPDDCASTFCVEVLLTPIFVQVSVSVFDISHSNEKYMHGLARYATFPLPPSSGNGGEGRQFSEPFRTNLKQSRNVRAGGGGHAAGLSHVVHPIKTETDFTLFV